MGGNKKKQLLVFGIFGIGILSTALFSRIYFWNWKSDIQNIEEVSKFFKQFVTDEQLIVYQKLIKGFVELLPNVTYFMMYGTLLGSYRHHGIIPWDADIDLVIRLKDMAIAHDILTSLKPDSEFKFTNHSQYIWRFFHNESEETGEPWKWPFLDIYFYSENSTHIWNSLIPEPKFEKGIIFPLLKRPFMGFLLPSPRCPKTALEKSYHLNVCVWTYYAVLQNHVVKRGPRRKELPCLYLYDTFPFVKRQENGTGTIETLELAGEEVPGAPAFFSETVSP